MTRKKASDLVAKAKGEFVNGHGLTVSDDDLPDILQEGREVAAEADRKAQTVRDEEEQELRLREETLAETGNMRGNLTDPQAAFRFLMAGNAYFTVRSQATGTRYTYRVSRAEDNPSYPGSVTYFVNLLTGPENTEEYTYVGIIGNGIFRLTRKSRYTGEAKPVKAFQWVYEHLIRRQMPPKSELWHEGRCGRCGRKLTVPESIEAGIGPECAAIMGV